MKKKKELSISKVRCLQEDTENFNRNLGTKNIQAREPPSMAEVEPYWK
jgi:hypothetical protein